MPGKSLLLIFIFTLTFCSCSITKRRYLSGYYIHHKAGVAETKSQNKKANSEKLQDQTAPEDTLSFQLCETPVSEQRPDCLIETQVTKKITKKIFSKPKQFISEKVSFSACKNDPENSLVQKPLSWFWIIILLVLLLYLAVILFAAESLLPLGHVIGIVFAALILLWLLRIV